jgi:uncharacterized protein (TIGR02118 family)
MRLIALYKTPPDPEAFDRIYFQTHLPLLRQVPGLERTVVTRFVRTVMGEGLYLMAEMYFADEAVLKAALKTPQMAEAGKNLATFAEGLVSLMWGSEVPAN